MTEAYVLAWSRAFALTLVLEACVAVPLLGRYAAAPAGAGNGALRGAAALGKRLLAVSIGNLASHPVVWFVIPAFARGTTGLALQESFAIGVEAATYFSVFPALGLRSAFGVSALANALSLGIGVFVRELARWP